MHIFVKTPTGKILMLEVENSDCIKSIKNDIQRRENIPSNEQQLFYFEQKLEDERTLLSYDLRRNCTLDLCFKDFMIIFIYIDSHTESSAMTFALQVKADECIKDLKTKIQNKEGISPDRQKLFFNGIQLENESTLSSYGISGESLLHLNLEKYIKISVHFYHVDKKEYGHKTDFEIGKNEYIRDLKTKIYKREGIDLEDQCLIFNGQQLNDFRTFLFYDIQNNSVLDLHLDGYLNISIIFDFNVKDQTVQVKPSYTVSHMKSIIRKKNNIYPEKLQRMTYRKHHTEEIISKEKLCEDEKLLSDYDIKDNYIFHIYNQRALISVQMPNRTINFHVALDCTFGELKVMILKQEGILTNQQQLTFSGKELQNEESFLDCHIPEKSTLILNLGGPIEIFINISDKIISLEVDPSDTVEYIKTMIKDQENIPLNEQRLTFNGCYLEYFRTLAFYNIQKKSNLILTRRQPLEIFISNRNLMEVEEEVFSIEVDLDDTILSVKKKIQCVKEGMLIKKQMLRYENQFLFDECKLSSYNMQQNSTINLLYCGILKNSTE